MQRFYLKTLEKITAFTWKHVTVCLSENNDALESVNGE